MTESELVLFAVLGYLFICGVLSAVGSARGHNWVEVFFVSLIASPIIGAIIYSHYNVKKGANK